MTTNWKTTTIGAQVLLQRGFDITRAEQRSGRVPVVSSGGIGSYHDTAAATGPGVVLGRKGVVGSVYFVKEDYWPHDTTLWVKDFKGNDQRFVYYFFKQRASALAAMDVGSANPTLNRNHIHPTVVVWPPYAEQRAIAAILGALDDKIELNRRTSETLEAMARALFKSWFVDFDPVHAKAEGRTPSGIRTEDAALFPSQFEASELGQIPQGWRFAPFEAAFSIPLRNGLTKPKAVRGSGTHMVNMGELFAHRRLGNIDMDRVPLSAEEAEKSILATGDMLFARQSLTLDGAGQCSIVVQADEPRTFESHLIRCRIDSAKADSWFFFYYFWDPSGRARMVSIVEQVAAAGIRASDLARIRLLFPPFEVQRRFGQFASSLEGKIVTSEDESRKLARLRDALLPRLLSGELPIRHAERFVEAHV